jgi:hypothetical protein
LARIKTLPRISDFSGEERDAFERVYRRYSADPEFKDPIPPGAYTRWALHTPVLTSLLSELGRRMRKVGDTPGGFSHTDREFVDQVLCADFGCDLFQEMHVPDAIAVGVRIEAIEALRGGRDQDLTADEMLLTHFVRGVAHGRMTDGVWQAMERRLGVRGTIEYAMFTAFLVAIFRIYQAFDMPGFGDAEVRELLAKIKEGSIAKADWRKNIR